MTRKAAIGISIAIVLIGGIVLATAWDSDPSPGERARQNSENIGAGYALTVSSDEDIFRAAVSHDAPEHQVPTDVALAFLAHDGSTQICDIATSWVDNFGNLDYYAPYARHYGISAMHQVRDFMYYEMNYTITEAQAFTLLQESIIYSDACTYRSGYLFDGLYEAADSQGYFNL